MTHQVLENPVLEGRQLQRLIPGQGLLAVQVQHQLPAANLRLDKTRGASHQGIQSRLQLLELERFDHVIIGTGGQPLHLVLPVSTGGENQDREGAPHAAQLANQIQPTHTRQAEIDDGNVMVEMLGLEEPFLGAVHGIDYMPDLGKARGQVMPQQRLVFDQQELHTVLRKTSRGRPTQTRPAVPGGSGSRRHQKW